MGFGSAVPAGSHSVEEGVGPMKTYLNRRELLVGAGVGAIGTAAATGALPATVFAADEDERVEGSWSSRST